ncbi:terminase [Micromonospora sp. NPDC049751]|uniref:terminase n=1 Tax=Micromonospora sp. NPDC049751 TaxID=3154837 RepID=UPI0033D12A63
MADEPKAMTAEEIEALEPTYIGPTWQRNPDGSWHLPERTLGWQIAGWCAEWLLSKEGGPWRFTNEQLRFLLWWYAVDEHGVFIYRKGVLQRMKGWGKDPLLAVLCLVELVGPSRFSHWDAAGNPVGVPHPQAWVQVTAVNQSQTTNTMALIPSLMSDAFRKAYGIKEGAILIRANGGKCRLEAVTSSYRALEGKRTSFTLLNESHHWILGNHGHQMYETIDGNATKLDSRYLAITNAYLPGEDSVGERMREAYDKMVERQERARATGEELQAVDIGYLYDSIEAHPKTPLTEEALTIVLPKIRGDAVWLNVKTIIQSIHDTTMSIARSRRMWLNQVVADEDAIYGPGDWEPLGDEELMLRPGDEIVVGFDGGKSDDSTALVGLRLSDLSAFVLGLWEKPDGPAGDGWEVNRLQVDSAVHEVFRTFKVKAMYADVALWESFILEWEAAYGEGLGVKASERSSIGWDMRQSLQRVTRAHERLMTAIFDGRIKHDGDRSLKRHVLNVFRRENNYGVSFGKQSRESKRKVDLYAALMLCHEAMHDLRTRGKKQKVKTGRGYFL